MLNQEQAQKFNKLSTTKPFNKIGNNQCNPESPGSFNGSKQDQVKRSSCQNLYKDLQVAANQESYLEQQQLNQQKQNKNKKQSQDSFQSSKSQQSKARNKSKSKKIVLSQQTLSEKSNHSQKSNTNKSLEQGKKALQQIEQRQKKNIQKNISKEQDLMNIYDMQIVKSSIPNIKYSYIYEKKNEIDENIVCDVCLDDIVEDGVDSLVICDLCNSATHQSCYGNEILKNYPQSNQWFCRRCTCLLSNTQLTVIDIKCHFCNQLKGMLMFCQKNNIWAHYTCVNWIPDVWFTNEFKNEIDGKINNSERTKLFCCVCRKKNTGSCIQCDYKDCKQAFHRENGESIECFVFCEKHNEIGNRDLKRNGKDALKMASQKAQIESKLEKFSKLFYQSKRRKVDTDVTASQLVDLINICDNEDDEEFYDANNNDYELSEVFKQVKSDKNIRRSKNNQKNKRFTKIQSKSKKKSDLVVQNYQNVESQDMQNQQQQLMIMMQQMMPLLMNNQLQNNPQNYNPMINQIQSQNNFNQNQRSNYTQKQGYSNAHFPQWNVQNQNQTLNIPNFQDRLMFGTNFDTPSKISQNKAKKSKQQHSTQKQKKVIEVNEPPAAPIIIPQIPGQSKLNEFFSQKETASKQNFQNQKPKTRSRIPVGRKNDKDQGEIVYEVEKEFSELIGLKKQYGTRKQIQDCFIEFAISANMINPNTCEYMISQCPILYQRMQVEKVVASDIFKYLKLYLKQTDADQ
ncbi:protein jade-3 [Stylonychia lemnae]|uniref:Protein jade-3 n=1 Tax=Stylonychia lemnae TaxID=5949 RepID=A0A078B9A4_STYLE|nr:protein jade-3 [Stylonychia lemnae]|eukprot:CDW90148.1 protein jade-3 [Stylonychia lemnae]